MKKIVVPLVLILVLLSSTIAFAARSLSLPDYPVNFSYSGWGSSLKGGMFDTHLSGIGTGFDIADGTYAGWCIQKDKFADPTKVVLYSSDDTAMPGDAALLPWDKVNYLLNNKAGSPAEIQEALWIVLGQQPLADASSQVVKDMASAALASSGFVPKPGQIIAVLLYSDGFGISMDEMQETIIELTVPSHGPGTGTPGYWKNHPEAWPQDSITIGGVTYTKDQAIALMGMPDGDKTYTMFRALVAGKLNVMIGNDASCVATTITDADNWMMTYGPAGSKVKASSAAWKVGEPLYNTLDAYNNGYLCAPHRD